MEKIEILADNPAVRARTHDCALAWRAAASGGADHRQAPDDFLGSDYRRHGGVTAQLSRAGKRRGDDDQGTTGKAKHPGQQANRVPVKNPGISFPIWIGQLQICNAAHSLRRAHHFDEAASADSISEATSTTEPLNTTAAGSRSFHEAPGGYTAARSQRMPDRSQQSCTG